jgi:hypothetical protein
MGLDERLRAALRDPAPTALPEGFAARILASLPERHTRMSPGRWALAAAIILGAALTGGSLAWAGLGEPGRPTGTSPTPDSGATTQLASASPQPVVSTPSGTSPWCTIGGLELTAVEAGGGYGAEGTALAFATLSIRNTEAVCLFALPRSLEVAGESGQFVTVPVTPLDSDGPSAYTIPHGTFRLILGETWPLEPPAGHERCASTVRDVTIVRIPLKGSDFLPATLAGPWREVCAAASTTTAEVVLPR